MTPDAGHRSETRWIRPLPERVVNKIAAGEVIERPSAVVKELVENSLDAGATRIDIHIEKSGVKLIKVTDNGCGIPAEQTEIAFGRHATSKISQFDDLEALVTYGFRGEALPSMASVSQLRMVSRPRSEQVGTEVVYEGGVLQSRQPTPATVGTTIEVANLFFNTPARRKFLKAETTEARHISRIATAMAMARPQIGFSFTMNGRTVFDVPADSTLQQRVAALLGTDKRFLMVDEDGDFARLVGCTGAPDTVQHNRNGQYVFINGRYVFSPTLSHAWSAGYGELIHGGTFPVGALLLTVDPAEVDVNVHPSKTEVKLSHERELHSVVSHAVRDALHRDGVIPALRASAPHSRSAGGVAGEPRSAPGRDKMIPGIGSDRDHGTQFLSELYRAPDPAASDVTSDRIVVDRSTGEIVEHLSAPDAAAAPEDTGPSRGFRLVGRFADLYLLLQADEDLYIVDQHTAHERVLYEETLSSLEADGASAQSLLFPAQVELSPEQFAVFEESREELEKSGFSAAPFGGRVVNIEAVPTAMSGKAPEALLAAVLDDIASLRKGGCDLTKAMAQSIACRAAVMAGDRLADEEAVYLLRRLLACRDKYSCPHGRPTFIRMSREDLDRQFGRG